MKELKSSWLNISHWLRKWHILPSIFWACALFVGHHAARSFFEFPEQVAYTVASNLIAQVATPSLANANGPSQADIVLKVDTESAHNAPYFGEIPTQRCALAGDLEKILSSKPRALVVDVDVSPTNRAIAEPNGADALCAAKLEQLLSSYAAKTTIIAITPSQFTKSEAVHAARAIWQEKMTRRGIHFGGANLIKRAGDLVTTYEANESISHVLCQKLKCEKSTPQANESSALINFSAFKRQFVNTTTTSFSRTLIQDKVVFFGFGIDDEDIHLTPLGMKHGIDIHAAAYASMREPLTEPSGIWDILLDVALGVLVGKMAHYFLNKYMKSKQLENVQASVHSKRKFAYFWLVILVIGVAVIGLAASLAASKLLEFWGIWLSPVIMILAMLMDALCRAPITLLSEKNHDKDAIDVCECGEGILWHLASPITSMIWYATICGLAISTFIYLMH
jgi:CHASE2 domain